MNRKSSLQNQIDPSNLPHVTSSQTEVRFPSTPARTSLSQIDIPQFEQEHSIVQDTQRIMNIKEQQQQQQINQVTNKNNKPSSIMKQSPFTITYITHKFQQIMKTSTQMRYIFTLYCLWLTLICLPELILGFTMLKIRILRQAMIDILHSAPPFLVMAAVLLQKRQMEVTNVQLTYGPARIKILAALVNCLFLLSTSLFTFMETFHQLSIEFQTNQTTTTTSSNTQSQHLSLWFYIVPFALMKILLSGFYLLYFRDQSLFSYLRHRIASINPSDVISSQLQQRLQSVNNIQPNDKIKQDESQQNISIQSLQNLAQNRKIRSHMYLLHSFYLVCLIQVLESVATIIGIIIMSQNFDMFETTLSFMVALVNMVITVPLLYDLIKIVLQAVPLKYQRAIQQCLKEIEYIEGVFQVKQSNFWSLDGHKIIGNIYKYMHVHVFMKFNIYIQELQKQIA